MKSSVQVSKIQPNDHEQFIELVELLNKVFEAPSKVASATQLKKLLANPSFCALTAVKGGEVVGGLTAYELVSYYTDQSELYIYDIAVRADLHGQGIGKELIRFIKDYAATNRIATIFVEAHAEDEQAVRFYQSTFGSSEKVDHFNFEVNSIKT